VLLTVFIVPAAYLLVYGKRRPPVAEPGDGRPAAAPVPPALPLPEGI